MADIFISFKHPEDLEKVRPLVEALRSRRWSVWWCEGLLPGQHWDRAIETELNKAKCIIVVWTVGSANSDEVRTEAAEGRRRKCLVQVSIEGSARPTTFAGVQAVDLTGWRGDMDDPRFHKLCAGVRRLVEEDEVERIGRALKRIDEVKANRESASRSGAGGDDCKKQRLGEQIPKKAAALHPSSVHIDNGRTYYVKGDYELAIAELTKAIVLNSESAEAYLLRGHAYESQKEPDRAIADYSKAIELDPLDASGYEARGHAYHWWGEGDCGMADLTKLIELKPRNVMAYRVRGEVYLQKGSYDQAIADYTKAIQLEPEADWNYYERGEAYYKKREYDLAIADFSKAISLNPRRSATYKARASAYQDKGEGGKAEHDLAEVRLLRSRES